MAAVQHVLDRNELRPVAEPPRAIEVDTEPAPAEPARLPEPAPPESDAQSGGVSDALSTTALGIIVAIPAVAFHNYVRLRSRRVAQTVERVESLVAAKSRFEAGREAAADS